MERITAFGGKTAKMDPPRRVKCQRCGWEWYTKSKAPMVTCAGCSYKTPNVPLKNKR